MNVKLAMQFAEFALLIGCVFVMIFMIRRNLIRQYPALFGLVVLRSAFTFLAIALLFHRKTLGLSLDFAYTTYFYSYWVTAAIFMALQVVVIYTVYKTAMKPLEGLQRIGKVIFRWVASVSIALSTILAFGPHVRGSQYFATLLSQVQEGVCVMTLCLLLFVCFATRPLGLTYRSRLFGVIFGLGISSCVSLVLSVWYTTDSAQSVYSPLYLIGTCGTLASVCIWATYFALPEPARKMILLPTTSPYFLWNRISEALGDEPGVVAVAGFTPAMLAPAEMAAIHALNHSSHQAGLADDLMLQPLALSR